ncbi:MAG: HAMP domain-containing histidine kinase [Myxococcales bacterium]|nr:HAMP domain-containing histidine kinase [Myxococcales bacterium]MCB9629018.1 HAMP domain-containing histidine kinase [Sandaracinaceae bacterium]
MARRRGLRSISVPITMGAIAVPLSAALLVGWTVLFGQKIAEQQEIFVEVWLLVLGAISFTVIIGVLVLLSYFLAREILEVRRQNSFIDSVTHELKSPLASIRLCLDTLARPDLPEPQVERLHDMMRSDVDRLNDFIDDVLQSSRLAYDGDTFLNLGEFLLADLLNEVADAARKRHGLPAEAIVVDVPESLRLTTDRPALLLVARNLVDNAIKYSNEPVRVVITAAADPTQARPLSLSVRDEGIGIPKAELKRVFHRFYRVEHEKVRTRKGTGLGLFVVSQLVRNLGGSIRAESEGVGRGSCFVVRLPMAPPRTR